MAALESFNGTTATRTIGKELERLGELGENARPEARALVAFIEDRSPVLQGRDEHDVIRIRALALGVLARIGPPPEAALLIAEQLDESDDPRSIAAAACAFKRLPGPKKWGLRGLITALRSEMMDEPLCLERSSTEGVPFGKLTTMRLEVLGALSFARGRWREALPVVAAEAKSAARAGTFHARIRQEAIKTLGEIESSIRKDASTAEPLCAACAADSASLVNSPWLAAGERENVLSTTAKFTSQDGRELTWADLTGQPTVVTFFYTHCVNPRRCDRTMALIGSLRKRLERDQNLVRSVRILCVTMEPTRDDPPALRRVCARSSTAGRRQPHVRPSRPDFAGRAC